MSQFEIVRPEYPKKIWPTGRWYEGGVRLVFLEKSSYAMHVKVKIFLSLMVASALVAGIVYWQELETPRQLASEVPVTVPVTAKTKLTHVLPGKTSLYNVLREFSVPPRTIHDLVLAAKDNVNLARLLPGTRFDVRFGPEPSKDLLELRIETNPGVIVEVLNEGAGWISRKIELPQETRIVTYKGTVNVSLWESAEEAQMDPNLISELAEIFAWQVDFAREVRAQDRWRISVERKFIDGEPVGWGSIVAAEYENAGTLYAASLFRNDGKDLGYYSPDGQSLRKMFLKSPMRFGRISSRFQKNRFHPILKIHRPHLGVDYAAPTGTPIRAVGDGVIARADYNDAGGKVIRIRHNSTYETAYKHLSAYGKGIRVGARVSQGQIIGYVGTTGLSTAPHLHFEFYQAGRFVDPLGKKFPSADPVPKHLMAPFRAQAQSFFALLPAWNSAAMQN